MNQSLFLLILAGTTNPVTSSPYSAGPYTTGPYTLGPNKVPPVRRPDQSAGNYEGYSKPAP